MTSLADMNPPSLPDFGDGNPFADDRDKPVPYTHLTLPTSYAV